MNINAILLTNRQPHFNVPNYTIMTFIAGVSDPEYLQRSYTAIESSCSLPLVAYNLKLFSDFFVLFFIVLNF